MKKIFFITMATFLFASCEKDESLDPRPLLISGEYVRIDVKDSEKFIDSDNIANSVFKGELTSPSGKIVRYELFIRRLDVNGIETGNFELYKTITSFPSILEIKTQDIANFYNINFDDVKRSEIYQFIGYAYDANGIKYGYSSLSRTVRTTASMKQAYRFRTTVDTQANGSGFNIYAPF